MKPSKEYLAAYGRLFNLVMAGEQDGREAEQLRAKMERLWPRLPGRTDGEKLSYVLPQARALYEKAVYGAPLESGPPCPGG